MKYAVEMGSGTKFHEEWFRPSNVNWGGEFTDTQTHSMEIA
jgi:hypothetical protein